MKLLSNRIQVQKSVIKNWKPRTSCLITRRDQKKTSKATKALLVKCAPVTGRWNCNGSQIQIFFKIQATLNSLISGWETFQIKQKQERKKIKSSSNIYEVIRAVLKFLFLRKDFARTKRHKKHKKAPKAQKAPKALKRNQTKHKTQMSKQK